MESIWQKTASLPTFDPLRGDKSTDVLIIGGGITGLLTAYLLKQAGVDCCVVEKGRICQGTTGHTTGKITAQHGLVYHKLIRYAGVEGAQKYLQANQKALEQYRHLCRHIDCDFEDQDNFIYTRKNRALLEREMAALCTIGAEAQLCDTLSLPFPTEGGVKFPRQAQFHPLKFLGDIAKDLPVYEHTFVEEMQGNTAVTEFGKIHAKAVVVATHFPFINKHGSYFLKLYQHRSYVIAYQNTPPLDGMYMDNDQKGFSFRNWGDTLLLGGGGHRTGKHGGTWDEIRRFASQYYLGAQAICQWATQDCISLDHIPYIGQYSARTGKLYTATGFNKWGMTGAMVAAQLLCDLLLGKENDFADVFSPSRSMCRPQLLVNGFESISNLLSFSSKRCPHLGCALKWNRAERTWDCPCHGSRFDEQGNVLDNPANGK